MMEFYEYCPVTVFDRVDPYFSLDLYFGDNYEYRFPDEFFKLRVAEDGQPHFEQDGYDPEFSYREFRVLLFDCDRLFIASHKYQIAWVADIPHLLEQDEVVEGAKTFVDAWYLCLPSPGQLAIQF